MHPRISRRNLLQAIGLSTLPGPGGLVDLSGTAHADPIRVRNAAARIVDGKTKVRRNCGIGEEMMQRLEKVHGGVMNQSSATKAPSWGDP